MLKLFGSSLLLDLEIFITDITGGFLCCAKVRIYKGLIFEGKLVIGLGYQKELRKQAARIKILSI